MIVRSFKKTPWPGAVYGGGEGSQKSLGKMKGLNGMYSDTWSLGLRQYGQVRPFFLASASEMSQTLCSL